ncbi:MAG TPA: flagellin [Syntrophales bacterium]|nr:flagellin [Syntrophales bacterium]
MGFVIQSNISALNANRDLSISQNAMSKSLERLSSGYRINSASDDAAGLAISQQFSADIASYQVASQNASQANSLLQVAGGAMDQIDNMLTRLKELATQAASANVGGQSNLNQINSEGNSLIDEIDRIANSTTYAGITLLNGTFGVGVSAGSTAVAANGFSTAAGMASGQTYTFTVTTGGTGATVTIVGTVGTQKVTETIGGVAIPAVGQTGQVDFAALGLTVTFNEHLGTALSTETILATAQNPSTFQVGTTSSTNDELGVSLANVTSAGLGLTKDQMNSQTSATTFLNTINTAISDLSSAQGSVGASQNRLGYANANLATTIQNYTAAQSTIRDVDMASEMTNFTKNQILVQAGTAMLAQANMAPQQVLSLFK